MLRSKDGKSWAFPECFDFLLESQTTDGGWGNPYSDVEQISCTMAATLAMKKHLNTTGGESNAQWEEINSRCDHAIRFIENRLPLWSINGVDETLFVGIELWLPVLLQQLKEMGVVFNVPGIDRINLMREKKLSKIPAEALYGKYKLASAHSLERFIGLVDFDQIHHQKTVGSMCGSPASTAVYLMYCTSWDEEAEAYLRYAVNLCIKEEKRSLPHIFPATTFQTTCVVQTLLESGFSARDFRPDLQDEIVKMLQELLKENDGITGRSKGLLPDPDNTASALSVLHLLGSPCSPDGLLKTFEGRDHFFTYPQECNPTISVNGNVLLCLLHLYPTGGDYSSAIEKCVQHLCHRWYDSDGLLDDKWPIAHRLDAGDDTNPSHAVLRWLLGFSTVQKCRAVCIDAVQRGRDFLRSGPDLPFSNMLWIGKTTFHISMLTEAYILSALNDPVRYEFSGTVRDLFDLPREAMTKQVSVYSRLPSFESVLPWILEASVVEAHFLSMWMRNFDPLGQKSVLGSSYLMNAAMLIVLLNNRDKIFLTFGTGILDNITQFTVMIYHIDSYSERDMSSREQGIYSQYERIIFVAFNKNICRVPSDHSS
ncbi:uncharacterized protein TRUGW13939_01258 [Talaromyces rugulosus]|uniref:Terpene synthase N-terminal domain-containing protein n=1 Tax=Talaromyces rugulosus TaxID=121627 RepID=A0A7H8QJR4_TALRU|nr:uncharacterized protein TRUGW13939_01258 [Talaromyces rugulosus]QKX54174.1 hypothetical protein TRUGW13939_01258 [Talaromyces rugulosus]